MDGESVVLGQARLKELEITSLNELNPYEC